MTQTKEIPNLLANPYEAANVVRAFVECSTNIQNIVLEMAAIIGDPDSDEDDRTFALDTMMEALFPGMATDVREQYRKTLREPEAMASAAKLRSQQDSFSDRVRDLMKEKGMTQIELAEAAGIGQPAISNILNRSCRPQRRTVSRLADALEVSPSRLWPDYEKTTA